MDIIVICKKLTDGSLVHDLEIKGTMHAVSEQDAEQLSDKLAAAIDAHCVESIHVRYVNDNT